LPTYYHPSSDFAVAANAGTPRRDYHTPLRLPGQTLNLVERHTAGLTESIVARAKEFAEYRRPVRKPPAQKNSHRLLRRGYKAKTSLAPNKATPECNAASMIAGYTRATRYLGLPRATAGAHPSKQVRRQMSERRALWAGTESPGGIATYIRTLRRTPLWEDWNVRLIVTHSDGPSAAKVALFARAVLMFVVELIRFRPHVVHLHAACNTSFLRKATLLWISSLASTPVVMHMHGSRFDEEYENSSRVKQAAIRATLRRASAVVALGRARAAWLGEIVPQARTTIIPNAIQLSEPSPQPAPGQPVRVAFLGYIGDRKGAFRLIDAWARVGGEDATLTIAGDGEVQRARRRIQELRLESTVEVKEWLSEGDVDALLRRTHVLVLPSRHEGQPMAVLEAMSRGICVVASDVGGLPEMIGDGCGVLIPPNDVEAIAAALKLVICDRGLRAEFGAAARNRVAEQFDLRTVWTQLDALYAEVSR
jgi:glycosyltransferase involved in cell wall biosynthesis